MIQNLIRAALFGVPVGVLVEQAASTVSGSPIESTIAGVVGGGGVSVALFYYFKGKTEARLDTVEKVQQAHVQTHELLNQKLSEIGEGVSYLRGAAESRRSGDTRTRSTDR